MSLRTHVIFAIYKRNLASYFSSVIGYLFIVLFVMGSAFSAFTMNFFANNLANLDLLTKYYPWLLLFIAPAIAMTSWSEERKQGTDELLFTLPATDLEVLLGKYFALLAIYTVAILYSLLFCAFGVLAFLTTTSGSFADFDKTLILCNFFGYWISGAALLTCGMVASALTSSATVAFIGGVVLSLIPVFIGQFPWIGQALQSFSVPEQLRDFSLGIASLSAVLYFVSIAVFMLYVNYVIISRRHWSGTSHGAPMWAHFLIRGLALVVLLVSLNVAFASASPRVDCTSEHVYSVFPTTRKVIQEIPKERPVFIQAFISPEVPGEYVTTRSNLIGLLRQYSQIGGRLLQVRIVDTRPYTDASDEAKRYGILGQQVQNDVGGKKTVEQIYLGAVVSSGADDEVVIPFFDVGTPVEYELTRSVKTVAQNKRRKVGILATDAKLFGGFDMSVGQSPEWRIVSELKKQYDVSEVSADRPIGGDFDVLIAAMPSSLTEPQMNNLVDYVKSGKPALIFDDPFPLSKLQLAPREPKPSPGGPMGHQMPPMPKADNGKATRLVNELGIEWDNGDVVWDRYNPHLEFSSMVPPEYVFIDAKNGARHAFSQTDTISSGLQEILILVGGKIRPREGEDRKFTALLRTSPSSGVHKWEHFAESRPAFFGMGGLRMKDNPTYIMDPHGEFVVAAHVTGATDGKGPNVVYVADLDMISDTMFQLRDRNYVKNLNLDNVTFVLNAVDVLAGDGSLVDIRKRRPKQRVLTAVEQYTRDFTRELVEQRRAAEEEAKTEIEAAKKRFAEARKKIDEQKLDPRTRQIMLESIGQEETRRIAVRTTEIENEKLRKVEQDKGNTERKIRRIESFIQIGAILIPPIPVLVVGVFVFMSRLAAEQRSIQSDRLRKK